MVLKITDIVVCLSFLIILALLGESFPNILGGATSLIIFVPIFYYISYVLKSAKLETTLLNIVILLVLGINLVHGIDISGTYSKSIIIVPYFALIVVLLVCIYLALTIHLEDFKRHNQNDRVITLKTNYRALALRYIMFSFLYVLVICIAFVSFSDFSSIKTNVIKMIPLSFICITVSLIALNLALRRIKSEHLNIIFHEADSKLAKRFKFLQLYFISTGVILILGIIMELSRNEWVLWFESFVTINITLILIWKVFRHRIKLKPDIETINLSDVNPLLSSVTVIKVAVVNIIGVSLVLCGLITLIFVLN